MAFVMDGDWVATVTFRDRDNNAATFQFRLPDTLDRDAGLASLTAVANAAAAISDAAVSDISLSQSWYNDAYNPATVAEASDVERKGVFQFRTASRAISTFQIPSILNTKVIDGTETINTTDAAVIAFQGAMLNTLLGAGNSPVTAYGEDYTAVHGAPYKRHRGSKRG